MLWNLLCTQMTVLRFMRIWHVFVIHSLTLLFNFSLWGNAIIHAPQLGTWVVSSCCSYKRAAVNSCVHISWTSCDVDGEGGRDGRGWMAFEAVPTASPGDSAPASITGSGKLGSSVTHRIVIVYVSPHLCGVGTENQNAENIISGTHLQSECRNHLNRAFSKICITSIQNRKQVYLQKNMHARWG